MMRRFPVATLLAVLAVLAGVGPLAAQQVPSPYRHVETRHAAGAFAGYLWTQSVDPDIGPQPAPLFGVRYGIRLGGPVDAEFALGLIPSQRTVFAARGVDPADPDRVIPVEVESVSMPLALLEGGFRLNLTGPRTWNGLIPYLAATGGVVGNLGGRGAEEEELSDDELLRFGPGFALSLGAGTEYFLSDRLSLRAEVRDQIWRIAIPLGLSGTGAETTRWTNNLGLSVGAALHF